jgi:predicted HTH domain antitoxin
MKFEVMMEFDESILPALHKSPKEFTEEIRLFAAAKWYELGFVSQERAAEIAGMNRPDFLMAISRIGVSPFQYSYEDVLREVENVR